MSTSTDNQNTRRRSSLYDRAKKSFFKSDGKRGCDIETLRGSTGADFEGTATITRIGHDDTVLWSYLCGCISETSAVHRNNGKEMILLVKGPFCFVYDVNNTSSPLYAIGLHNIRPIVKEKNVLIVLETNLGDPLYEIRFNNNNNNNNDSNTAEKFENAINQQSSNADTELIRKKLGHETLVSKRKSVLYAEQIALQKFVKEQPSAPLSAKEVLDAYPQNHQAM